jgi:formylmethanofuran dehydrogenase subunit A
MLEIRNGTVYDPLNGINGHVQNLWVKEGRIVSPKSIDQERVEIIDATGLVVMPGGVDIHSHIAGPKVNAARKFRPEDHFHNVRRRTTFTRSGTGFTKNLRTLLLSTRVCSLQWATITSS